MNHSFFDRCALGTALLLGSNLSLWAADDRPNIVVFIADDVSMDLGCYGNKNIHTPNLDRLATQGVRFDKAFLTSPQSSPSRTSMMTGMFAHTIRTEDLHDVIDDSTRMMPSYFREQGYVTGSMLKRHWGDNGDRQFDQLIAGDYSAETGSLTEDTFENYERFIDERDGRPFFLWVGFIDAHRGYNRTLCAQRNDPDSIEVPPFLVDTPETRRDMADYYDEITRMDGDIGRMIDYLEREGLRENTIIVFLGDNGKPFPRCKGSLYDTGIQTPMIFSWGDRFPQGARHSNGLVSTIDLAATLLHFAGATMDEQVYSRSFHPLLFDPTTRGREYIFSERNWHDTDEYMRTVRSEELKLIYNAYYELPHGTAMDLSTSDSWYQLKRKQREEGLSPEQMQIFVAPRPMIEVYDVAADPLELTNVADQKEYVARAGALARELVKWQQETDDHGYWERRRPDQNDRVTGFPIFPRKDFFAQ